MAINYIHCTQVGHVEPALINMFTTDKVLTNATLKEVRHNLSALIVWSIYIFINIYIYIPLQIKYCICMRIHFD